MKSPVKIDDVARHAGVSPKTVSRVVNGEAYVRAETKELVERAIASLGYRPNLAARSLAAARSFLVGVVSPYLDSFYFRGLHHSTIKACKERGLHVIVEPVDLESRDYLGALESTLKQMRFEGVVLTQPVGDQVGVLDLLDRMRIRYVRIAPAKQLGRSDSVSADNAHGLKLLAEHLWSLGHRRVASAVVRLGRRDPFRDAFIKLGAKPSDIQTVALNWRQPPAVCGRELAASVLSRDRRATAVYCFNDVVAAGLISYAWAQGLNVPQDLSVAGFDDDEMAQATWPPLTTIRQPLGEMARVAVELLMNPVEDGKPRHVLCPVELVVRESTATAPDSKR